jgi:methylmalonyl-CoA mutase
MDKLDGEGPVRLAGGTVVTAHDWDVAAAAVLRRGRKLADDAPDEEAWDTLAATTVEGLVIPPLGTPERAARRSAVLAPAAPAGRVDTGWDIRSLLTEPDPEAAAAAALADLENGATSLWVTVGASGTAPVDLGRALDGVFVEMAPIAISAVGATTDLEAARALADVFGARGVPANPGSSLGADPIGRTVRGGVPAATVDIGQIAALASSLGVRAVVADGTVAHESGAGDAAELGYAIAVGVAYLRALETDGASLDDALSLLEFRLAATDDQFVTSAKFRAARGLWTRVAELSGAAAAAPQFQHAVTSLPMLTRYDPWVNLLRTTVAAFAAGVGGADAVTVLPFDTRLGIPDALGRRMARNTSSLLINESHVAAVTDPAGGSHAVEILTAELAEAGWAEFQRIEQAGGILAALADGSLRSRWAVTAAERARRIATRRQPLTGVSEFPNLREVLPTRRSAAAAPTVLEPTYWAGVFEDMRDAPATVPVFLATLGTVPEHAARAGFAANLFAAGGVESVTAGATDSVAAVVAAFAETGSPVACLAGSDKAYGESGAAVVEALRAAGATWVALAGRPKGQLADLVDDHVAVGDDVVEFLRRTRTQLDTGATKEATR